MDDDSSDEEGFFKPNIKIVKEEEEVLVERTKDQAELQSANNLIYHARPTDYLPRMLCSYSSFIQLPEWCCHDGLQEKTELLPIKCEKTKKNKYPSLKDKYLSNQQYQLVYSKFQPQNEDYNSSIFSLRHTSDYNPKDYWIAGKEEESQNKFQSKFQSGNLSLAYKVVNSSIQQYDLVVQNDTNTKGYNQWFFFQFSNGPSTVVKFNIVNLIKKHSLFEDGVKPVACNEKDKDQGWREVGRDVEYQKSYINRQVPTGDNTVKNYYCLSFVVDFQHKNDRTFLALNYPYTYTKMVNFVKEITPKTDQIIIQRSILGYTISNNAIVMLRIRHKDYEGKKKIVVLGRQHPGETVSSFTFQGFIRNVINDQKLLMVYEIVAVPMVNPDGVIYGNFRTNLSGFDLNRQWLEPDRSQHPEIFSLRKILTSLKEISFILDFHGHSKKYNSFIFACSGQPIYPFRVFPFIFSKQTSLFSIKDCTYNMTTDKERTARIQMFRQVGKPSIFTVQTSFFGYEDGTGKKWRWTVQDLHKIGEAAAESMKIYLMKRKQIMAIEKEVKDKEYMFDQWNFQMRRDDIQSESNPSEDQLTPIERKEKVMEAKITKKRSKPPSKKRIKKPLQDQLATLNKQHAQIDSKRNLLLMGQRKSSSKKNATGAVIVRKKVQRQKTVPLSQNKFKSKKVERAMSIIAAQPPKPPIPKKKEPQPSSLKVSISDIKQTKQRHKSSRQSKKEVVQPKKQEESQSKVQTITSNLFNKPNFYNHFQKFRDNQSSLYHKTQSLEVHSNKKQISFNVSNIDVLKKLISNDYDNSQPKTQKRKDRSYLIRDSKPISSAARLHEEAMKKNLQEQISNRTEALRNCQRKMNEITFKDGLIEQAQWELPRALTFTNSPVFPSIHGQKKYDYFNF